MQQNLKLIKLYHLKISCNKKLLKCFNTSCSNYIILKVSFYSCKIEKCTFIIASLDFIYF